MTLAIQRQPYLLRVRWGDDGTLQGADLQERVRVTDGDKLISDSIADELIPLEAAKEALAPIMEIMHVDALVAVKASKAALRAEKKSHVTTRAEHTAAQEEIERLTTAADHHKAHAERHAEGLRSMRERAVRAGRADLIAEPKP